MSKFNAKFETITLKPIANDYDVHVFLGTNWAPIIGEKLDLFVFVILCN